jgi:hypothetical protein
LGWGVGSPATEGDFPDGIAVRADATVLVGGESASVGAGSDDAFVLKLDANGKGIAWNS